VRHENERRGPAPRLVGYKAARGGAFRPVWIAFVLILASALFSLSLAPIILSETPHLSHVAKEVLIGISATLTLGCPIAFIGYRIAAKEILRLAERNARLELMIDESEVER
jgi:hypothetical protein